MHLCLKTGRSEANQQKVLEKLQCHNAGLGGKKLKGVSSWVNIVVGTTVCHQISGLMVKKGQSDVNCMKHR